mmetsp:Transcript_22456/g.48476  ORF Transcript_22456/g.48476 Transcript_22456/m.48476 type:complete len:177 (-) Transcript_22456:82-612(-)
MCCSIQQTNLCAARSSPRPRRIQTCREVPDNPPGSGHRCPVGHAVLTHAFGELTHSFNMVIHTVPPSYGSSKWRSGLNACYQSSLRLAEAHGLHTMATPLLGCGARGAPALDGAGVAADALCEWDRLSSSASRSPQISRESDLLLRFAIQQETTVDSLIAAMDSALERLFVNSSAT